MFLWADSRGKVSCGIWLNFLPMQQADFTTPVGEALASPVQAVSTQDLEDQGRQWAWLGFAKQRLERDGLLHQGQFDLRPVLAALTEIGAERLVVRLVHAPAPLSRCAGLQRTPMEQADGLSNPFGMTGLYSLSSQDIYYQRIVDLSAGQRQETRAKPLLIQIIYGYQPLDAVWQIVPLLSVLFLSIALTFWMRRQALRAQQRLADPALVWFGYARFLNRVGMGLWLLWIAVALQSSIGPLLYFVAGVRSIVPWMLLPPLILMWPPVWTLALCHAVSQPVFQGVRGIGWTRAQRVSQVIWGYAAWMLPALLFLVGSISVFAALIMMMFPAPGNRGELWMGIPLLALAPVARICALKALTRAGGGRPQAHVLESGALHERITELAEQAGVQIRYIFIFATRENRHANAFATEGNNLIFTDYLLQHFTRQEIDATVAHELVHLKYKHPTRTALISIPIGLVAAVCGKYLTDLLEPWQAALPSLMLAQILVFLWLAQVTHSFFSRRYERAADMGAVALTGDPAAYVSMLVKISRLNFLPLEWGKWNEAWLTHPSAMRRIEAVARHSQLSDEQLHKIMLALDDGSQAPSPDSENDRYLIS